MLETNNRIEFSFKPIGIAHTPFNEKFAIPRQANLAPSAVGEIELLAPFNTGQATEGLESTSYIWLIFVFHQAASNQVKQKVRPPRLGGNQSLGVFATRSPYRPCSIGQSLVKLESVSAGSLAVSGLDLLDKTPILDIKPFIGYADNIEANKEGWAQKKPALIGVRFSPQALERATHFEKVKGLPFIKLIQECLSQNPKPAYQEVDTQRIYGCRFWHTNIQFKYLSEEQIEVCSIDYNN